MILTSIGLPESPLWLRLIAAVVALAALTVIAYIKMKKG